MRGPGGPDPPSGTMMNIIILSTGTPVACALCYGVLFLDDASLAFFVYHRRRKVNLTWVCVCGGGGGGGAADTHARQ